MSWLHFFFILLFHFQSHFINCECFVLCYYFRSCEGRIADVGSQFVCIGELSCENTRLGGTSDMIIYCVGAYSCRNSIFYNIRELITGGVFSLTNTTIYQSNTDLYLFAYGYFDYYNLTIYCEHGSLCYIDGQGASVDNINCIADGTSTCYVVNNEKQMQMYVNMPKYYHGLYVYEPFSINYMFDNTYDDALTSNSNDLRCDGYSSCSNNILLGNEYQNLYCIGYLTCTIREISVVNNVNDTFIICAGKVRLAAYCICFGIYDFCLCIFFVLFASVF